MAQASDDDEVGGTGQIGSPVSGIGGIEASLELRVDGDASAAHTIERAIRTGQAQLAVSFTTADAQAVTVRIGSVSVRPSDGSMPRTAAKPWMPATGEFGGLAELGQGVPVSSSDAMPSARGTVQPPTMPDETPVHHAVIWLSSRLPNAEQMMRMAVVSIDALPGSQIEGISALYCVSGLREPDSTVAVLQLSTILTAPELARACDTIAHGHEHGIAMSVVQFAGETGEEDQPVHSAAVLAPWWAMNPDASVAGDPIAYCLALADDADRVGLLSDNWIIGETS